VRSVEPQGATAAERLCPTDSSVEAHPLRGHLRVAGNE
jgi:hypothetical protein